jgi:hypothetical protein
MVLAVYFPDEEDRIGDQTCITCDVRTLGRQPRVLARVPVLQSMHGLHDHDLYVPRPAAVATDGSSLRTDADDSSGPTPAELTDGDRVLVGWLDGSDAMPFIWPVGVPHPRSRHAPKKSDGRKRRIRFAGAIIEIDEDGNVLVDARSAAKPGYTTTGAEQSNSGTGGTVKLTTKDGAGAESTIELDASGNVKLTDGAGDTVQLLKSGAKVRMSSGVKHEIETATYEMAASIAATIKAPSTTITGAAGTAASVTVDAASILLSPSASAATAATLIQHTGAKGWAPAWALYSSTVLSSALAALDVPPTNVSQLLPTLKAVWVGQQALATALLAATTVATKAS